jgi:hypothetical protein
MQKHTTKRLFRLAPALVLATAGLFSPLSAYAQPSGPRHARPEVERSPDRRGHDRRRGGRDFSAHRHSGGRHDDWFYFADWVDDPYYGYLYIKGWASYDGPDDYRGGRDGVRRGRSSDRRGHEPRGRRGGRDFSAHRHSGGRHDDWFYFADWVDDPYYGHLYIKGWASYDGPDDYRGGRGGVRRGRSSDRRDQEPRGRGQEGRPNGGRR